MKTFKLDPHLIIMTLSLPAGSNEQLRLGDLVGLKAIPVLGAYKGVKERSYMMVCHNNDDIELRIDRAITYGRLYNQESILYSDQYRNTWLIDCNTAERTNIGTLQETSMDVALHGGNYTYVPQTQSYWIAQ